MSLTVRDVITRAGRLLGSVASGDSLTADEGADALVAINSMKRAMMGTIIGPRLGSIALTGTTGQAENGGEYAIPVASFTLTAPLNPKSGARFGVTDANLNWTAQPLTIARNGRLINGSAANYVISTLGTNTRFWYRGDTGNWVIEADYVTLDDAVGFPDSLIDYLPLMLSVVMAAEYGSDLRPEVVAGAAEGRQAFARSYARRGRNQLDAPIGVQLADKPQSAQQG